VKKWFLSTICLFCLGLEKKNIKIGIVLVGAIVVKGQDTGLRDVTA
jgi:hypothetical protein